MKKQLSTDDITKELTQSVFFEKAAEEQATKVASNRDINSPSHRDTTASRHQATTEPRSQDTLKSSKNQAITVTGTHDTTASRYHDTVTPATFETIRKAVKQLGKEAATHRFTEEEKRALGDIVYTYERQGYRTSENEITRIAIHCLLQDYQQHGAQSVLARLLETLHK